MNPMDILKAIKNPKEYVLSNLGINSNPMLKNLVEMANRGDSKGVENFARNYFNERGQNLDELMSMFK